MEKMSYSNPPADQTNRRQQQNKEKPDEIDIDHVPGTNYDIALKQSRTQYDQLLAETETLRQQCQEYECLKNFISDWHPGSFLDVDNESFSPENSYPSVKSRNQIEFADFSIKIDPYVM
ncbi:hypothetical protein TRFO_06764 [Tritrichomonas foetus]|uniref:Uncharacterized protein n=1 Tax=Tritrichomonas foetus TaxID=1144522 RepID=A0A1J4K0U2_9EUKA|nr:hypothetical protein TRFO_06764 [Tritrichomonas foetus]|eukprot:OHT03117.1 hypothetical protein TRFO_06764 [Tritrichomonas foetus]